MNQFLSNRVTPVVLALSALLLCAGRTHATEISGTISTTLTIYDNSELVGDVTCMVTDGPCVKFGAPDITRKLNGFTISGRADPPDNCTSSSVFAPEDVVLLPSQPDLAVRAPGLVHKFQCFGIVMLP